VELAGGGTDTVRSWTAWTLGDHLENLTLLGGALVGTGNGLANALTGNGSNNTLNGMGGNDTLTGAGGNDIFVFTGGFGADVITDFSAGAGIGDRIRLETSWMADFADVLIHATDTAGGVVIARSGLSITLTGVTKAQLNVDDFQFVAPAAPLPDAAKDAGPQVLPDDQDAKPGLFSDDDAIICPVFDGGLATDVDTLKDDWTDLDDALVLPFDMGPKAAPAVPVVCDTAAGPDDPGHPLAFVTDTEALLAERGPNRLMSQPTWVDWVI